MQKEDSKKVSKILLVDDDIETREMYAEILAIAGFDTFQADDGVQGLEMLNNMLPDIIFTGISMPNMDGFTLVEKIRENPATANIPIVISSHMGKEEDRIRAQEMGVRDFIVKNRVTPRETVERMNAIFSKATEYKLIFDKESLDAPSLLKGIGAEEISVCPSCSGKLLLSVTISDFEQETLSARLACENCDWRLK